MTGKPVPEWFYRQSAVVPARERAGEVEVLLINSIKSCNSFSSGQLLMMKEIEKRTGKPAAFVETDLVDPRYFSSSNVKNRLESYFQMIEQKRSSSAA